MLKTALRICAPCSDMADLLKNATPPLHVAILNFVLLGQTYALAVGLHDHNIGPRLPKLS